MFRRRRSEIFTIYFVRLNGIRRSRRVYPDGEYNGRARRRRNKHRIARAYVPEERGEAEDPSSPSNRIKPELDIIRRDEWDYACIANGQAPKRRRYGGGSIVRWYGVCIYARGSLDGRIFARFFLFDVEGCPINFFFFFTLRPSSRRYYIYRRKYSQFTITCVSVLRIVSTIYTIIVSRRCPIVALETVRSSAVSVVSFSVFLLTLFERSAYSRVVTPKTRTR